LDFVKIKNEIIAAIYSRNSAGFKNAYSSMEKLIFENHHLSEEEQKAVNQVQSAVIKFSKKNDLPFFEGFHDVRRQIRKKLAGMVRRQIQHPLYVEHGTWRNSLGIPDQCYPVLIKTTAMLQLSTGCSHACRRCNEWALPGTRKHFSFAAAGTLVRDMFQAENSVFSLYGASDPLDWRSNGCDITDLLVYMKDNGYSTEFGLLTKIPRGTEKTAEKLLTQGADIAVSITSKNRSKVRQIEKISGKHFTAQHDVEDLEIPSGMDEDFSSIKSSITDYYGTEITPEGASLVIPTFTSALHPTGQKRIPVTPATGYFLKKRTGRDALTVEYFKPLDVVGRDGAGYTLESLLDVQVETILLDSGDDLVTPPGMMNLKEYFRTFEEDAVLQRKTLMPAAVKAITKAVFQKNHQNTGDKKGRIRRFKKLASGYLDSCDMERIIPYKLAAFSFFLSSISDYLERHPAEREVILFLRRDARSFYKNKPVHISLDLMHESGLFNLFQALQFRLLEDHREKKVIDFIERYPAHYDNEIKRFILKRSRGCR